MAISVKSQKLEKPRIDKFTGDTTIETKEETLQNKFSITTHALLCTTIKMAGHYMIRLRVGEGVNSIFEIHKGDKAAIKFSDGKIIELLSALNSTSDVTHASYTTTSTISALYDLTDDDISDLKTKKIAIVRVMTTLAPLDFEISDGKSEILKKQLTLITSKQY
ncbi:MAG: hypothetical protein NVSMB24_39150 [Mucilaginibacter sp.]